MAERTHESHHEAGSKDRNRPITAPKSQSIHAVESPLDQMHFLQRTVGNRAVERLYSSGIIQPKALVSRPGDMFEQEADSVAKKVMNMQAPGIQRKQDEEEEEPVQARPISAEITPLVQRQAEEEEEEAEPVQAAYSDALFLQREEAIPEEEEPVQSRPISAEITPLVQRQAEEEEEEAEPVQAAYDHLLPRIQRQDEEEEEEPLQTRPDRAATNAPRNVSFSRDGGSPMPEHARSFMESRFGTDFSGVKVHTDSSAAQASRSLNAQAFTSGRDVYFNEGKYNPESTAGKGLLAHELTHVVQQRSSPSSQGTSPHASVGAMKQRDVIQRAAAPAAGERAASEPSADVAPGVMELKGNSTFEPEGAAADYFAGKKSGKINVRFGDMARGAITVSKKRDGYVIRNQRIPLTHPLFNGVSGDAETLRPSLVLNTKEGRISGYVGIGQKGGGRALTQAFKRAPDVLGLAGFDLSKLGSISNSLEGGTLRLGLKDVTIQLGGAFSGKLTLEAVNDDIAFKAGATVNVKQLASGSMELKRSASGDISGKAEVNAQIKNVSGTAIIIWDKGVISGEGKVGYTGEKLSGEVTVKVMEKDQARQLEEEKKAPPESEALKKKRAGRGKQASKTDYVVFGEGDLTFAFTDWLAGSAHVIIDQKGFLTIIGKITPQKEIELFPQKDYNKKLFKVEARASYGIPVVGNIFIFANIGMDAFANIGPGKLYNIVVEGTYSTDPRKSKDFSIRGSLNISAGAGLRLRGEAGAGLEILAHDIKAGAGINAIAAIRGYAEATPIIGYREKAAEGEDKKGEFFIRGELEIAAQPFLGLGGDLFVEIDAPWWSPVPDKKWTWPLVNKEWPLGGSLGVNAAVDYVFGSNEPPAVEFKPVEFDADKFMTDLYSDNAKPKSGGAGDKKGKWQEKNAKGGEPPKKAGKGDAAVGKAPDLPSAKATVQPGIPKKTKQPVNPNARTAEGKSVKEYQEEAAKKDKKPGIKEPKKGTGKEEATEKGKVAEKDVKQDASAAKEVVKTALKTELPRGAQQVADVKKVLSTVAPKVKPSLTNLNAEEVNPGKPKNEGAIGFKVKGKQAGKGDFLIGSVKYSAEGKALSIEERWKDAVEGVKKDISKLLKRDISEETIRDQFPRWEARFGFKPKSLTIHSNEDEIIIEGTMNPTRPVASAQLPRQGKTRNDAIPVKWPKLKYPDVELIDDITVPTNKQKKITAKPGSTTNLQGLRKSVTIGVPNYLNPKGIFGNREERGTTKQKTFRNLLKRHGYHNFNNNADPYQADHVVDYTFGGPDITENLWPLENTEHSAKTDDVWNKMKVTSGRFKNKSVSQVRSIGKTFKERYFDVK